MRYLVVSGYGYWGDFTPKDLVQGTRQVGGGETAMISISKELAALGNEVIVFYNTKPGRYDGVDYLPMDMFVSMACQLEHDVLVSWDVPDAFRFRDRAKMHVLAFQLNDARIGVYDWTVDKYFHPSEWHMNMFHGLYPEMTKAKSVHTITNGINYSRYTGHSTRDVDNHDVIYSSSPDRGLHHLLRMWPGVLERVPDAKLHVYYDMDKWLQLDAQMGAENITHDRAEAIRQIRSSKPEGVIFHGGVGQSQLALAQMDSHLMVYPCDPVRPTEGFSMSILEGIASGAHVITSDADALPELWGNSPGVTILPLPVSDGVWVDAIVDKLNAPRVCGLNVRPDLSWAAVARRWETEVNKCLKLKYSDL